MRTFLIPRLTRSDWRRPSVMALVAANLLPLVGLALLVVLKIMLDLCAHLRERAKFAAPAIAS